MAVDGPLPGTGNAATSTAMPRQQPFVRELTAHDPCPGVLLYLATLGCKVWPRSRSRLPARSRAVPAEGHR
ncbi:hypothetical protein GA0115234_107659 [Streptomyces sp. DvalAA-43]|nr:hypothetical protein GA0115234_107659 [Streptomyces sp. DvalAA-43]